MSIYDKIIKKDAKIAVIGLGYVGLPIALAFAKKVKVIGFDINEKRVNMMKKGIDPSNELTKEDFKGADITFTHKLEDLKTANFFIVAVPTPIDEHNLPDLKPLLGASTTVGKVLKKGDYVVYESTVYPGCTEDDCIPVLEQHSGLNFIKDFKVGYSPERINPGDREHTITKILKVVSGCDKESLENISKTYEIIVEPGTHKAASIKVAEAAKIIENTQRDVNIALMNELSIIFSRMGINTYDVLEAAGTKWNFQKFFPGLVGGHCIGVDPYYLTYRAEKAGYDPQVILAGRGAKDGGGQRIARECVRQLLKRKNGAATVTILGMTFKENVPDTRNSKVADIVSELRSFGLAVQVHDPLADPHEVKHEYGIELMQMGALRPADAVIFAVAHEAFVRGGWALLTKLL